MPLELTPEKPPYYEIDGATTGIKQYIALLTQSGTNNPTATELLNTLGTVTPTRTALGRYKLITNALWKANKTFIPNTVNAGATGDANSVITLQSGTTIAGYIIINSDETDEDTIYINSVDETFTDTDISTLLGTATLQIQITVYP